MALLGGGLLTAGTLHLPRRVRAARPIVGDETPLTALDEAVNPANNSPLLVADPDEPRFVVAAHRIDAPNFGCELEVSGDAGRHWAPARPVAQLPGGAEKCYAPEAAFDRQSRLYYLFVGLAGSGNRPVGAFLTVSIDRGRTWSVPHKVLGPLNFSVRMAIDRSQGPRGRIHLVWLRAIADVGLGALGPPPNPIMAAYSDDGGTTFSAPVQVSDPERQRVVAPALALGPDHAVHVGYYDLGNDARDYQNLDGPKWDEAWTVVLASSTDGGRHFRHGVVVDAEVAPPERVILIFTMPPPSIAVHGAEVCAAWADARTGDPDAVLRCSADTGRDWGPLRRLNDDAVGNGRSQYLPRISVSPSGRLDAVFFDRRADPANRRIEVFYTFSTDGGRHLAHNIRLSAEPSDSQIGSQYAGPGAAGQWDFGSRLGLLSTPTAAVAAWPDTRNSLPRRTSQEVYATVVSGLVTGSGTTSGWLRLVGGALGAAGVAVAAWAYSRARQRPRAGEAES